MAARKAGSIVAKGRNKYLIRWFLGRGLNGKRRYGSKTIDGTYSQAQKALGKEAPRRIAGVVRRTSQAHPWEYMTTWLKDVAATEVKEATLKSYTVRVKVDLIDRIGGLKLDKVTPQVIQGLYTDLSSGVSALGLCAIPTPSSIRR